VESLLDRHIEHDQEY